MNTKDMQNGLGQYLSFLEQRIRKAQTIELPLGLVLEHAPPKVARDYMVAREKERCYRQTEEELRRLFPEIDFYGSLKDERY